MIRRALITRRGTRSLSPTRQSPLGALIVKADRIFKAWIRHRDGRCGKCGVYLNLEGAHLFTCGRMSTRWDPDNCMALCHGCHVYFTSHPNDWTAFLIARLGEAEYDRIRLRSLVMATDVPQLAINAIETYKGLTE